MSGIDSTPLTPAQDPLAVEARLLLRPGKSPPDLKTALRVSKGLKGKQEFKLARLLLERAREHPSLTSESHGKQVLQLVQQQALCQSKDTSLPYRRHVAALELLREGADLDCTADKETLGIAGGILKRMWARSGETRYLTQGLDYYVRGHDDEDDGYNGINAAFLNDQLATVDDTRTAQQRCETAKKIRESLAERMWPLPSQFENQWWYRATVAEALLGLHRYSDASQCLRGAKALKVDEWERKATATQLADLRRLHDQLRVRGLVVFMNGSSESRSEEVGPLDVVRSAFPGPIADPDEEPVADPDDEPVADLARKMGIALSGGGFRASFYHLGVLARLADENQLRRVEVLSCVSGGSIVGAHYYLEIRRLLQTKADKDIGPTDYVDVVSGLIDSFLKGVKRNLRTRVLASPRVSLAILFDDQTRTKYLGDLLEAELYSQVNDDHPKGEPRFLTDLLIKPPGQPDFDPRQHNWRRTHKVPALVINATTLNTGHLWQFTATWMGEPPGSINPDIDLRERLRRLYYKEAPPAFQRVRLGHAVAASACVPGLFEPLELEGLYPNRKVCLVDGGVFDNQGVEALLGEECQDLLVSDATGPLTAEAVVTASRIGAPLRSNAIAMNLVRDRQYQNLDGLRGAKILQKVWWVHLAQGAKGGSTVDWEDCQDPSTTHQSAMPPRKMIDERISALRTDLDAFSEVEAYVLMANGYRMIERAFNREREGKAPQAGAWPFLAIEPIMEKEPGHKRAHQRLLVLLGAGGHTLFKIWHIKPWLTPATVLLAAVVAAWLSYAGWTYTDSLPAIRVRTVVAAALAVLAIGLLLSVSRRVVRTQASLGRVAVTVLALIAWIPARLQLHLLDPWFLRLGEFARLPPRETKGPISGGSEPRARH